jgi:hypothetical protein
MSKSKMRRAKRFGWTSMAFSIVAFAWKQYGAPGQAVFAALLVAIAVCLACAFWQSGWVSETDMRSKTVVRFSCAALVVAGLPALLGFWLWPLYITVSPEEIQVGSKEWTRVDTVTVTNHQENPRYMVTFTATPVPPEIEYRLEGPMNFQLGYSDGSTDVPIYEIGPKASLSYQVRSKLKAGAKVSRATLRFEVTTGTEEPKLPGVVTHP